MIPAKTPTEASGFKALLKNRPFLFLWTGQVLSQVADKVLIVMSIALLTSYNIPVKYAASSSSYLMVATTIPAILFGAAAGIFVDRYPKKKVMVVSDIIRGGLILLLPILPKEFIVLLIITFAISTITQAFAPAEQSAIPLVVKPENLLTANALFTTTQVASIVVGFAIAEPILTAVTSISKSGSQEILVASLYFVAAGLGQLVRVEETIDRSKHTRKINPWNELKVGFEYLRSNKILLNAMLQLAVLFSTIAALPILSIKLTAEVGLKPEQFGFLVAAMGIGLVFGSGILGHWGSRIQQKSLPLIGFIGMSIVLAIFTFVNNLWVGLFCAGILGLGASLIAVPMQTLIQEKTPESMRGKVFGFQNNAVNIALSVPLVITGPLTDRFGLQPILWGMSIIVTIAGIWTWNSTRHVLEDAL
ncbi:MFS transporter [Chamaesiphon sp. VAR_48_metabat_135_sub]|uniref:MFS transporter n=1 Tax=Chamaesiphon sp. VAR_48_metabat_135_sub TaxID=2964699 RepID=UPI00286C45FD|nr:MFS transporter [Chamaesiphon sp. VAR_48_metabat_135_sub]